MTTSTKSSGIWTKPSGPSFPASHDFVFVVLQFNAESFVELGDGAGNNNRAPRSMSFDNG
jgi:hypothetical protein